MRRTQRVSKRRKQELKRLGIGLAQGHRLDDNGLQLCRALCWDAVMPSKDSRNQRRQARHNLKHGEW